MVKQINSLNKNSRRKVARGIVHIVCFLIFLNNKLFLISKVFMIHFFLKTLILFMKNRF